MDAERDNKRRILRDQIGRSSSHLNKTTGLIQFCIEILKEPDAVAYLQIGNSLCNRTIDAEFLWNKNMITKPEVDGEFKLDLDTQTLQHAIASLEFVQLKGKSIHLVRKSLKPVKLKPNNSISFKKTQAEVRLNSCNCVLSKLLS